jgi:tRNA A-37 threonylcarbamoyl transferase component Bud32
MEFVGNIARKTGEPTLLAVEATKTRLAHAIGKESGLFYVPKVLSFDAQAGVLELERIDGLVTIFELATRKDARLYELLGRAGRALALVHEKLVLPDEMKYEMPPEWIDDSGRNVFIHGDLAVCNLLFHEESDKVVILDWSAAPVLGRTPTYGSRLFDVAWFINSIFLCRPRQLFLSWDAPGMADAFFGGYAKQWPKVRDLLTDNYVERMRRCYRRTAWYLVRRRSGWRAAGHLLYQVLIYPIFALYRPCREKTNSHLGGIS